MKKESEKENEFLRIFVLICVGADPSILSTTCFRQMRKWKNTQLVISKNKK